MNAIYNPSCNPVNPVHPVSIIPPPILSFSPRWCRKYFLIAGQGGPCARL